MARFFSFKPLTNAAAMETYEGQWPRIQFHGKTEEEKQLFQVELEKQAGLQHHYGAGPLEYLQAIESSIEPDRMHDKSYLSMLRLLITAHTGNYLSIHSWERKLPESRAGNTHTAKATEYKILLLTLWVKKLLSRRELLDWQRQLPEIFCRHYMDIWASIPAYNYKKNHNHNNLAMEKEKELDTHYSNALRSPTTMTRRRWPPTKTANEDRQRRPTTKSDNEVRHQRLTLTASAADALVVCREYSPHLPLTTYAFAANTHRVCRRRSLRLPLTLAAVAADAHRVCRWRSPRLPPTPTASAADAHHVCRWRHTILWRGKMQSKTQDEERWRRKQKNSTSASSVNLTVD